MLLLTGCAAFKTKIRTAITIDAPAPLSGMCWPTSKKHPQWNPHHVNVLFLQ